MERGCFNCKHKNDVSRMFRCAECADGRYYLWTPMTNADRIRAMSDEELAEFITGAAYDFVERPGMCDVCDTVTVQHCEKCWLDFLKQEVESDG